MAAVYYSSRDVVITGDRFVVRGGVESYRLSELRQVGIIVLRPGWRRRIYVLQAIYRGRMVVLHRTEDAATSARVRRALVRALEMAAVDSFADERLPGRTRRGDNLTIAGGGVEPPRDPWLDPVDDQLTPSAQTAAPEPRWRTILERLLGLPLTTAGAMTVAAHRFDNRMTTLLSNVGNPNEGAGS